MPGSNTRRNILTEQQKKFCIEYLKCLNAAKACVKAGYSKRTAKEQGARLLTNVNVKNYISERQQKNEAKTEITRERWLAELESIGFANINDFVNGSNSILELKHIDRNKTAAVSGVKTTVHESNGKVTTNTQIKFHDKEAALEKIGRHLGYFEKDNKQKQSETATVIILPDNGRQAKK